MAFLGRGSVKQIVLSCFVSVVAVWAHFVYRPFREPTLNALQGVCLIANYVIFQSSVLVKNSKSGGVDDTLGNVLLNIVSGVGLLLALAPFVFGVLLVYNVVPRDTWERAMLYLSCATKNVESDDEVEDNESSSSKVPEVPGSIEFMLTEHNGLFGTAIHSCSFTTMFDRRAHGQLAW